MFHEKHCKNQSQQQQQQQNDTQNGSGSSNSSGESGINKSILNNIGEPRLVSSALQSNSTVFRVDINNIINMNISTTLQEAMQKLESVITNNNTNIKYYFSLSMVFQKFTDANQLTDPPVVFRTKVYLSLAGSDLESNVTSAHDQIIEKIENYQNNGSGWVFNQLNHLDVGKK